MICMKKLTSIDEISNSFDKFTLKFSTTHSLSLHTSAEFDQIFNPAPVISAVTAAGICSYARHQACQNECVCVLGGGGGCPMSDTQEIRNQYLMACQLCRLP